jgi:hypothetical protein
MATARKTGNFQSEVDNLVSVNDVDKYDDVAYGEWNQKYETSRILRSFRIFRWLHLITAVIISAFSLADIMHTVNEFKLSHVHGILGLGIVKLFFSIGELQMKATEFDEVIESEGIDIGAKLGMPSSPLISPSIQHTSSMSSAQTSSSSSGSNASNGIMLGRKITMTACFFALIACACEMVRNIEFGGHYGAALLCASELVNQFYRIHVNHEIYYRRIVTMVVACPAALFAAKEIIKDTLYTHHKGANHAVAVLATAQFVENFYRVMFPLGAAHFVPKTMLV